MLVNMEEQEENIKVPQYGIKVKLNHIYPENWSQNRIPTVHQLLSILPLILRYIIYYIKIIWQGRRVIMDYVKVERAKQIYGVPIGGIGCGTIGRGFKGEFCRYQLRPGLYDYNTIDANQFIVTIRDKSETTVFQSLLSTYKKKSGQLSSWKSLINGEKCNYTGLYPRAWTEYDLSEYGVKLICRQISPIIPHNYKDSSLPCAVFVWNIENISNEYLHITISFTFKNGIGVKGIDSKSTCSSKPFSYQCSEGVVLYHQIDKTPCSYALAAKVRDDLNISKCVYFDPKSDGKIPWSQLLETGRFDKILDKKFDNIFGEMAVGIAVQTSIAPANKKNIEFSLVWDIPVVSFFYKKEKYNKYYTKIFGSDATLKMVDYSLMQYTNWEVEIYKWQDPILSANDLPDWYKGALFNETYFISDGGSIWIDLTKEETFKLPKNDPRVQYGRFAYLEGHEYRMFNTYDVHFYASFALVMNWPMLQQCIQYDIKDSIFMEIPDRVKELFDGAVTERKVKNTVPHDLGDPEEEPFLLINSYLIHDVSEWKDLNPKFVLQVFRDYYISPFINKTQYLEDMYKALTTVMDKSEKFDIDGDGIIDNSGSPDQTFDTWVMTGPSAYCGGLWLSALYAMIIFADIVNKPDDKVKYQMMLEKGKQSFERKLWNGKFYNFDITKRSEGETIMADQLCGQWYLRSCGYNYEVFPKEKVKSSLKTIYENNVLSFCNGSMGAVNGFTTNGKVDVISVQSEEVWTGVTYALAASMIHEGMFEEAWRTAGGLYKSMNERLGLCYETPEALYEDKYYRSIGYMRPLSIWSIQLAWNQRNNTHS